MRLGELRNLCVSPFSPFTTRREIFRGLLSVIRNLRRDGVIGDLWIDGSFLTKKPDPNDVDIVLKMDGQIYDDGPQSVRDAVDWLLGDLKSTHRCDSYHFFRYPSNHPNHPDGEAMFIYWSKLFGFSRTKQKKGIAVVQLREVM